MRKNTFFTLIISTVLAMTLPAGCGDSSGAGGFDTHLVSGLIYDQITGEGLSCAKVIMGSHGTITDATGYYSLDIPVSETTVNGLFYIYRGSGHMFRVFESSLNVTSDMTIDIPLMPNDTDGYPSITLTGTVKNNTNTEIPTDWRVRMIILNADGGQGIYECAYLQGAGYSLSIDTFGNGCTVIYHILNASGAFQFSWYEENVNLSGSVTRNLTQPSGSSYTAVSLYNGTPGARIFCHLEAPAGMIPYLYSGILTGASPQVLSVYNPDNLNVFWYSDEYGSLARTISTPIQAFSSTVYLPAWTLSCPGWSDADTITYADGTLSFLAANGTDNYYLEMENSNGYLGWLFPAAS